MVFVTIIIARLIAPLLPIELVCQRNAKENMYSSDSMYPFYFFLILIITIFVTVTIFSINQITILVLKKFPLNK